MESTPTERLARLIEIFKQAKPNDRSEVDRRYAIVITELEKAYAYAYAYIDSEGQK